MGPIDDWYDWWRIFNAIVCCLCLFMLLNRWRVQRSEWATQKIDFWFALCVWNFTGLVSSVEGVLQDLDLGTRVLLVTAGALVTHKALYQKHKEVPNY